MKRIPLHTRIFLGLIVGVGSGILLRNTAGSIADLLNYIKDSLGIAHIPSTAESVVKGSITWVKPVGDIFLHFIFMMIIPLILSALTLGVADMGNLGKMGRIGLKMFKYTLVVTSISVLLGIGLVTLVQPGKALSPGDRSLLIERYKGKALSVTENARMAKEQTIGEILTQIVPKNPLEDMVRAFDPSYSGGGLLAVMFFALIIGLAISRSDPAKVGTLKSMFEGLYEITMKVINWGMKLAPFGVASLLFVFTVDLGVSILLVLLRYVVLVMVGLLFHQFVTYSIILKFFAGMSPAFFFRNVRSVMLTAFSTSSSNATLPTAIRASTENLKLPKDIAHFILTIGSTANQNGTALYEGVTILFLAQCFGVHLGIMQQIFVVILSVLAGIGSAGVPGGSMPVIVLILMSIGVPGESIALIFGVDRILDMSRTVLNVTGDITAAAYISHQEQKRQEKELRI